MDDMQRRDDKFVKPIDFSGSTNLASNWKSFKSQFNIFKIAKGYSKLSEEEQIANMLVLMGPDSVRIYEQFQFSTNTSEPSHDERKKTLTNVIKFFDEYFEPVKNVIYERVKFNQLVQEPNQSIHQFIIALQTQVKNCDYGAAINDELVRDRIVVGVRDKNLREYLIDIDNLDLPTCIQKAKQYVSHHEQAAKMHGMQANEENADAIEKRGWMSKKPSRRFESYQKEEPSQFKEKKLSFECEKCGNMVHKRGFCPAVRSKCLKCNGFGHWAKAKACPKNNRISEIAEQSSEELEGLFLDSLTL